MLRLGYTDVWSAETDGADGFTPLALAVGLDPGAPAGRGHHPRLHPGPALLAQSVAAMAEAAPGRFTLGLGTSSDVIVSRWNGMAFDEPYRRARDTIRLPPVGAGRGEGRLRVRDLHTCGDSDWPGRSSIRHRSFSPPSDPACCGSPAVRPTA